jgi:hypothetical protein
MRALGRKFVVIAPKTYDAHVGVQAVFFSQPVGLQPGAKHSKASGKSPFVGM